MIEGIDIQVENQLSLTSLHLQSFRNYDSFTLHNIGALSIFIGLNAVGKTSILEAIQLMTALKSFRTSKALEMVQWGKEDAQLSVLLQSNSRKLQCDLSIHEGKRTYSLNGKHKRVQDLKGLLPAVTFSPDDLSIIKGSSSLRLQALDDLGTQLSKNFYSVKKDYTKLIRQKNQALKDNQSDLFIDSINELLIKVGVQYLTYRNFLITKLSDKIQSYYQQISQSKETVQIAYIYSWDKNKEDTLLSTYSFPLQSDIKREVLQDVFQKSLEIFRSQERIRERSLLGPHADHLFFLLNGKNATLYASQGQQRTIILAWKLAESALLQEILHQKPILLLDDVMSELDEARRESFLNFITDDIQTCITTTNSGYFQDSLLQKATLYELPFYA